MLCPGRMLHKPARHRLSGLARLPRTLARAAFFNTLRAALQTDDGRRIAIDAIGDLVTPRPALPAAVIAEPNPYRAADRRPAEPPASSAPPVFITARFRSGSTLLWNLFRQHPQCTAYYEPLNERRWFDASARGSRVDASHRNVDDYWREYVGFEELARHYTEEWTCRRLYMDEHSWDPGLATYLRTIIGRANGRAVLKFNRVDFRLPWLRHTFPEAVIVHLYRDPRDQWCSCLRNASDCGPQATMSDFARHDGFYLGTWARDLRYRFPFLDPAALDHPYELFYFIWKLSYLFGRAYADHSVAYEHLVSDPVRQLSRIFDVTGIDKRCVSRLAALVEAQPERWPRYAEDAWFRAREERCEDVLRDFMRTADVASTQASVPTIAVAAVR